MREHTLSRAASDTAMRLLMRSHTDVPNGANIV
jgi:hypothetical protein